MAPSSPDERESLSGGEASGGYGAAPSTRGSFNVGLDPDVGYCEATEEDERQARLLRRGLAQRGHGSTSALRHANALPQCS